MPSEITHKSAFRIGPIIWAMVASFIGGYIAHAWHFADTYAPPPCPAAVSAPLVPGRGSG